MSDKREFSDDLPLDDRFLQRLAHLRTLAPMEGMDPVIEQQVLRDLRRHRWRKSAAAGSCRRLAGDYWEMVLVSILFCLLGLDLVRIIRFVLR